MMKGTLFIIFMSLTQSLFSQEGNLVSNPSFENKLDFKEQPGSGNWTRCLKNDTPDYITFTERGEPDFYYRKYIGGLLPYDGDAYVGIFCYRIHPLRGIEEVREFIQAPLLRKLEKDSLYEISIRIALDPESNTAINNFNAYFSDEVLNLKREKDMYNLYPRVKFKKTYYDSSSWMELKTQYKARGYETQIALGNFRNDQSTGKRKVGFESEMEEKWDLHELEKVAYYYVDMVSVIKSSETIDREKELAALPETPSEPFELENDTSIIEITRIRHDSSVVLNQIFFEFDESILLPESYKELNRLCEQLQIHRDLAIVIEGHTDNLGTYEYNIRLSLDRAQAVADYLLGKGLEAERLSYQGYGYTRPLSDNRTEDGRKMNRRVAFRIIRAIEKPSN